MGKEVFLSFFFVFSCLTGVHAQQSRSLPLAPPGIDRGRVVDPCIRSEATGDVLIGSVPSYLWQRGCGPTSVGMIVGYYDQLGFADLIPGESLLQTDEVNDVIANDDHYNDYSLPLDYYPNLLADKSQIGGAHASNCIADFMETSWSSVGNYWGWSWLSDLRYAFQDYVRYINSEYRYQTSNVYHFSADFQSRYMAEIDHNHPVVFLVDTDGDGGTDHFVTGIGYNLSTGMYAIYDTWDRNIHWFAWRPMASGSTWGIYSFTTFLLQFTITVSVGPEGGGLAGGGGYFEAGQSVELQATANEGYLFSHWSEDGTEVSTSSVYTFSAHANQSFVAHFVEDPGPSTPETQLLSDVVLSDNEEACYGATQSIQVAGDGTFVQFMNGSVVTLIAGQSIRFLDGFHAEAGSSVAAWITPDGTFCDPTPEKSPIEKSGVIRQSGSLVSVSTNSEPEEATLAVFPNPVFASCRIVFQPFARGSVWVRILDLSGSEIQSFELPDSPYVLNLAFLRRGLYLIQCTDGIHRVSRKIIRE
ncbi:MAG TPA: hypothetical protein PLK12_10885 [Prolixibacteraceae bacterium]|nr:hypothetical protein [Prolixibacteraceae bacterium]